MNRRSKKLTSMAVAAAMAVAAVGVAAWLQPWSEPEVIPPPLYEGEVVARVAGQPIYLEQALYRVQGVEATHSTQQSLTGTPENRTPWPDLIIQSLADDVIIRTEASKMGLDISPMKVAAYVGRLADANGGLAPFETRIGESGLTIAQYATRAYMNLLGAALYLKVTEGVEVAEGQVRAYFEKNRERFDEPNDEIAYAMASPQLEEELLKKQQDIAWQDWLKQQESRGEYEIDVLIDGWWKDVGDAANESGSSE